MTAVHFILKSAAIILTVACISTMKNEIEKSLPANARQELPVVYADTVHSEANNIMPADTASVTINYGGIKYTIHGYKSGNVFVFEKDMLLRYSDTGAKAVAITFNIWPKAFGRVTIPYVINKRYAHKDWVMDAMAQWMAKVPQLKFVPWIGEDDYIEFDSSISTQSYVGNVGEKQTIELSSKAFRGNIIHELGHCLGLLHEQSRSDRDMFVTISCSNRNYGYGFKLDTSAKDFGAYNYYSIMHYPIDECLSVPKNHIPIGGFPKNVPGQRDSIAVSDYMTIKAIYGFTL